MSKFATLSRNNNAELSQILSMNNNVTLLMSKYVTLSMNKFATL